MSKIIKVIVESKDPVGKTGISVSPDTKIKLIDIEYTKWIDADMESDPLVGWNNFFFSFFNNLKQSKNHNYMQLIYSVGSSDKESSYRALKKNVDLKIDKNGILFVKANDVILLKTLWFYSNNKGTATLTFEIED